MRKFYRKDFLADMDTDLGRYLKVKETISRNTQLK